MTSAPAPGTRARRLDAPAGRGRRATPPAGLGAGPARGARGAPSRGDADRPGARWRLRWGAVRAGLPQRRDQRHGALAPPRDAAPARRAGARAGSIAGAPPAHGGQPGPAARRRRSRARPARRPCAPIARARRRACAASWVPAPRRRPAPECQRPGQARGFRQRDRRPGGQSGTARLVGTSDCRRVPARPRRGSDARCGRGPVPARCGGRPGTRRCPLEPRCARTQRSARTHAQTRRFRPRAGAPVGREAGRGATRAAERASRAGGDLLDHADRLDSHGDRGHHAPTLRPRPAPLWPDPRQRRARRLPRGGGVRDQSRRPRTTRSVRPGRSRRLPGVAVGARRALGRRLRGQSLSLRGLPLPRRPAGALPTPADGGRPAGRVGVPLRTSRAAHSARGAAAARTGATDPERRAAARGRQRGRLLPLGVRHRGGRSPARRRPRRRGDPARHDHLHARARPATGRPSRTAADIRTRRTSSA